MLYSAEFWVGVSFLIFLGILVYAKVPGMLAKTLDDRAEAIRKELDGARRLREEAQDLLADYQRKQREAEGEAQQIIEGARREAAALKAEGERSMQESLARRTRLAEEKIARAEAQAIAEVRSSAVDSAIAAAEKILKSKAAAASTANNLVEQGIKDLGGKLN